MSNDELRIQKIFIDVPDLAVMLGKTEAQIRNMHARGQLPKPDSRPGIGRLIWLPATIETYVLHGLTPPPMRQAPHPPPARARAKTTAAAKQTPMELHRAALREILGKGKGS